MTIGHTLTRTVFQTSRVLEFFTEKERMLQIGFPKWLWPLALIKELIDNALDACETSGIPPDIAVTLTEDIASVQDNGPGLPASTLERWHTSARFAAVCCRVFCSAPSGG